MTLTFDLCTAIITPFTTDGAVDFPALERVTQHLIDTGSDAILVNGSTGENPTVSEDEKIAVLKTVKAVIGSQPIKLIAGASTNCTQTTLALCKATEALGVDALLVVVPYYNKPSQEGLLAHFGAIASQVSTPVIIYNIPGRSIIHMTPETVAELAKRYDTIIGIKQSSPDMDAVSDMRRMTPDAFQIWCGDDSLTLPMMAIGANGCFSVAGHLTGKLIRRMVQAFHQGDLAQARALHLAQMDVFKDIFFLPNPTVVKACLAQMGLCQPTLRLPLTTITRAEEQKKVTELVGLVNRLNQTHSLTSATP